QNGGLGNDILDYTVSAGRDRADLNGGWGNDNATIRSNSGDVFQVVDANGRVLYSQGKGDGTVIRMDGVENYQVLGDDGRVLYTTQPPKCE
ncbi:MAG: hypothetical protein WC423_02445, partial [Vulcanimicrobiota bacterium]